MTALRLVEPADVGLLESELGDESVAGDFSWFGFADAGRIRRRVEAGETITPDHGTLAVADDDGVTVGSVGWRSVFNGPPPNGQCWEIGIWLAPEHRGKGHGSASQRALAAYLFAHTLRERVQASTEVGNIGEQKALERAGFSREGVLRRACFRDGQWRDMVLFAVVRGEL